MKSTLAWARIIPSASSEGWTIHFIERQSRYWVSALAGHKDELLFQRGTQQAWQWAKGCSFIRWFTDGEHRYAKALWDLASVYLALRECPSRYRNPKSLAAWPGSGDESEGVSRSAAGHLGEARASLHRD